MSNKTKHNKKVLIEALKECLSVVSHACEKVGISRKTYYDYYNNDPDFKEQADEASDIALDFVESKLYERITNGSDAATIFYLKTKGRHRGYQERIETKDVTNEYAEMTPEQQQREIEEAVKRFQAIKLTVEKKN